MNVELQEEKKGLAPAYLDYEEPALWRVVFHDDSVTPRQFVAALLQKVYDYSSTDADAMTSRIEIEGRATVGVYMKAVADTKKRLTDEACRLAGFPLEVTVEREEKK